MLPRRLLFGILILLGLMAAGVAAARQISQHPTGYYNCLYIGDIQIQLNTHLEHIQAHAVSPDGKYLLGSIQRPDSSAVFVENVETGKRSFIQTIPPIDPRTVRWLPDGERVYYGWHDQNWDYHSSLATRQGHLIASFDTDFYHTLDSLSSDGKYGVIVNNPGQGAILTLDNHPQIIGQVGPWYEWSPIGNRIAYLESDDRLAVLNIDEGTLIQTVVPVPRLPVGLDKYGRTSIHWSPDARYLSVIVRDFSPELIYVFSIENNTITPLTEIGLAWRSLWDAYWSQSENRLVYFLTLPGPHNYELWNFDVRTQENQLVASELWNFSYSYDDYQLITLRKEGDFVVLEYRDSDGSNPRDVLRFTQESGDTFEVTCRWWRFGTVPSMQFLQCDALFDDPGLFLLNEAGEMIWPRGLPAGTRVQRFVDDSLNNSPFVAFLLSHEDQHQLEILDFETQGIHRLPSWAIDKVWPLSAQWSFVAVPWPNDDESWLIYLDSGKEFRFWPAQNKWEYVEHPYPYGLWSPDGQRIAFLKQGNSYFNDLIVQEADGSKEWNLGSFAAVMYANSRWTQWTQCGDILAPLRDDLAAQKP